MNILLTSAIAVLLLIVHVTSASRMEGEDAREDSRRAMWHSTRQAEANTFKQLLLATLHEVVTSHGVTVTLLY